MLGIILLAIIFFVVSKVQNKNIENKDVLPTRDTAEFEGYATLEEFCRDLTASQEYDDPSREESFYQECLASYSL